MGKYKTIVCDDRVGMCSRCKEWTSIKDSCCGVGIWFEGSLVQPEFEEEDECDEGEG